MKEQSTLPEHDHFTVVFEGNLREIRFNPFMTDTPFGLPRHVGVGNAFEEFDEFIAVRGQLLLALKALRDEADKWGMAGDNEETDAVLAVADAAIAKAEGATP